LDKQMHHMDQLVREKFEHFAPTPPEHVWAGVQKGIAANTKPAFFGMYKTRIAAAAVILLLASLGLWWFLPSETGIESDYPAAETGTMQATDDLDSKNITPPNQESEVVVAEPDQDIEPKDETTVIVADADADYPENRESKPVKTEALGAPQKSDLAGASAESTATTTVSTLAALDIALQNETTALVIPQQSDAPVLQATYQKSKNKNWSQGIYFTPEFMLSDFDSVQLLPSYAINYEPTYHFSEHWFIRFGIGTSYQRERGFAKLDYISNDMVGTYEQVYEVTFDSIGGNVVPTYHTKTTDVWDSVRHIQVTEVTNKYVYVQTPLLFGYYKKETKFNWYIYGGPAFNVMVSKWIDEPQEDLDLIEIVNLQNNLPERSPYYMQLWLGAGIEYKIGKQLAIAFEPNYRYYFNHVYKDDKYKTALSSFSLRIGVVFNVK